MPAASTVAARRLSRVVRGTDGCWRLACMPHGAWGDCCTPFPPHRCLQVRRRRFRSAAAEALAQLTSLRRVSLVTLGDDFADADVIAIGAALGGLPALERLSLTLECTYNPRMAVFWRGVGGGAPWFPALRALVLGPGRYLHWRLRPDDAAAVRSRPRRCHHAARPELTGCTFYNALSRMRGPEAAVGHVETTICGRLDAPRESCTIKNGGRSPSVQRSDEQWDCQ